jgi:hypothetical protein
MFLRAKVASRRISIDVAAQTRIVPRTTFIMAALT